MTISTVTSNGRRILTTLCIAILASMLGGSIGTDEETTFTDAAKLPQEPFLISSITLHRNRQITDVDLERLKGLTKLTMLLLADTQVSDTGLEHIKGLTNLRKLVLLDTQVSDNGLEYLKGLTNLTELHLKETKVTAQGIADLKKALPKCDITWDGTTDTPTSNP